MIQHDRCASGTRIRPRHPAPARFERTARARRLAEVREDSGHSQCASAEPGFISGIAARGAALYLLEDGLDPRYAAPMSSATKPGRRKRPQAGPCLTLVIGCCLLLPPGSFTATATTATEGRFEADFDSTRFSTTAPILNDTLAVTLLLELKQVTGQAGFDDLRVTHRASPAPAPGADPSKPIFRGHDLPRLRGAMAGTRLTETDIEHFARSWGGNLLRWQFFEAARKDRPLDQYDAWLDAELEYLDRVLGWCRRHGVLVVVDLHSPPGGEAFSAGYITARGDIFRRPEAQAKFIEVWQRIARRYRGNEVIWGFDLLNEPDDSMLAEGCFDWQRLAERAALAVREIDPTRTLIFEPNGWGSPGAFRTFRPIAVPNCVYSFHLYAPHPFTHQGIQGNPTGLLYPGTIAGKHWDKNALRQYLEPAISFAERHRVHMFVGEFSAIRTAPEASAARYLADATALFEELGYDWTYHAYREWQGWSLEHEGPLQDPRKASEPTDREQVVTHWFKLNQRPLQSDPGS
jgi:endoglucanase